MLSTLRQIGRQEGVTGYFKGNGTNVIRIAPYSAVQFAAYEKYKQVRPRVRPAPRGGLGARCSPRARLCTAREARAARRLSGC